MKPLVLILEDSLTERMALRALLGSIGCMVSACGTLKMAREMVHRRAFDLVILDVLLSDGNGATFLEELKSDPQTSHLPSILVSSRAHHHEAEPSPRWRADAYFQKPYLPKALTDRVQELMQQCMGGKRYLLVDDSPTFLQAFGSKLRQAGNEVLCAASGEEALALLSTHSLDCVIIDMIMPGMGGLALCKRIRALPGGDDLALVMLTASENLSGRSAGLNVGADEFLIKQYDMDLLNARLRNILRKVARSPHRKSDPVAAPRPPSSSSPPSKVYEQALVLTGLSHWVARLAINRACALAAIAPTAMTLAELRRILPALGENLRLFMSPEEAAIRLHALNDFTESLSSPTEGVPGEV